MLLITCACGSSTPNPVASPAPTRIRILAGETIRLPVEPNVGPTEENATLTFHFTVVDKVRRTPVKVRSVKLGDHEIVRNVNEFSVQLPGNTLDIPLLLHVEADGYETWESVFRHRVYHSRVVYFELELSPDCPSASRVFRLV